MFQELKCKVCGRIGKKGLVFLRGAAMLTVCSLLMRTVGVGFNVYITGVLGAGGVGLFSLITSAYGFFSTFALSGVNLAASKLCAEGIGHECADEVRGVMRRCLTYSLCFGGCATLLMLVLSYPIGVYLIGDQGTVRSLRVLAPSLIPLSLSSGIYGYLHAVRRVGKSALLQISEQLARILLTVLLFRALIPSGASEACVIVSLGITVSELLAFSAGIVIFRHDITRHLPPGGSHIGGLTRRVLSISLPMAFSSYMRSGLLTLEHMLIPSGLRRFGSGSEGALEQYGILHGMAFPVILYPQVLLASVSGLLVPEVSEEAARGNGERIERIAHTVLRLTLAFSIGTAGVFLVFGSPLGQLLYNNADSGRYILLLAPLIPVMYLDSTVDGMLKGLGEQLYSMKVNILDSAMSVVLVLLLLPRFGTAGYILTVYITELLNGALSLIRLLRIIRPQLSFPLDICTPVAAACTLTVLCRTAPVSVLIGSLGSSTVGICALITTYIVLYSAAVFLPTALLRKKRRGGCAEISKKGLLISSKL